jgi:protein TonB
VRAVLLVVALVLSGEGWSQASDPASLAADVAKFRSRLASDVARFKGRYPKEAAEKGQEGRVVVVVAVNAEGRTTCTLKSSSGHEILDQRALAVVRYAASNVPLPQGLRGVAFSTQVALQFRLGGASKPRLEVT